MKELLLEGWDIFFVKIIAIALVYLIIDIMRMATLIIVRRLK